MGWCHFSAQRLDIIVLVARGAEAAALRPFTSALAAPVTTSVLTSPVPLTVSARLGPEVLLAVKGGVNCLRECRILLALFRHKPANVAPELAVNRDDVVDAGHLPSAGLQLQVLLTPWRLRRGTRSRAHSAWRCAEYLRGRARLIFWMIDSLRSRILPNWHTGMTSWTKVSREIRSRNRFSGSRKSVSITSG